MAQKIKEAKKARLPVGKRAGYFSLCLGAALLLIFWINALLHHAGESQPYELTTFSMGSYVRQTVWGTQEEQAAKLAVQAVDSLEWEISWRDAPELGGEGRSILRLNQSAGRDGATISPATGELLETALALCETSCGAFDITLGPLTRLWDFDGSPRLPKQEELTRALALTGWQDVLLDETRARLARPGMAIDLGAIGKGAACDRAVDVYRQNDVTGAVVAVGGSIGLYGKKPQGQSWRVSVRNPEGEGSLGTLELESGFVSTSGSYEKFFQQDGKTYCHLLDPRTGYPAESGLISVTVWHPESGALSDGLSTACFVLGLEESLSLLREYQAQGVFVDQDGTVTVTEGFEDRFIRNNSGD